MPDFTMSHVERQLEVETSLGPRLLVYRLVATLPRHALAACGSALPRPRWEPLVQCCVVSGALFLFLCSLAYAYLERDRILHSGFYPLATMPESSNAAAPSRLQPFDLRSVGSAAAASVGSGSCSDATMGTSSYKGAGGKRKSQDTPMHQQRHSSPASFDVVTSSLTVNKSALQRPTEADHVRQPSRETEPDRTNKGLRRRLAPGKQKTEASAQTTQQQTTQPLASLPTSTGVLKSSAKRVVDRESRRMALFPRLFMWLWTEAWVKRSGGETVASVATQTAGDKQALLASDKKEREEERKGRRKKAAEEETSSTTTETSNADSDLSEKDHAMLLPDVCASAKMSKNKHSKLKGGQEQGSGASGNSSSSSSTSFASPLFNSDATLVSDTFETSAKGKTHKKIKVDRKRIFGDDILRPSTLELPYKPKTGIEPKEIQLPRPEALRIVPDFRKTADLKLKGKPLAAMPNGPL